MPRPLRTKSSSGFYHIIQRGIGKQVLFEENNDYCYFLKLLAQNKSEEAFELHAYCLMDNHFHLLIRSQQAPSQLMRKLLSKYATYYNKKYGRTGHLFQDCFKSEAVETQEYYFTVIRYILHNPAKAHICAASKYKWSSYWDYLRKSTLTDTDLLLHMIGGSENFRTFIESAAPLTLENDECLEIDNVYHVNDTLARKIIINALGTTSGTELQNMDKLSRDIAIKSLYYKGLSIRQMERLTGIGRGIISRAIKN